jgi:hypothetical protein
MGEEKPGRGRTFGTAAARLGERLLNAVFYPGADRFSRAVTVAWLVGLLLFGGYLWGVFYSWGNISLDFLDWAEVTGPRYALLKDALSKGEFPLHAANQTALRGVTDRYFAIPDTPFSPEIIALRYLKIRQYLFYDTLLWYGIGFAGLLLLRRKYQLSPLVFLLLFLLFNFNGCITGHLAVGHSIYTGYFLLPFFILLVLDLLEREQAGWKWVLGMAALQLVMLLQGSFHLYLWCLMFLALLALFNLRLLRPVALAGIFSVLVGLPRLLPPALAVERITHEALGGLATVMDLFVSLAVLRDPDRAMVLPSKIYPLRWWEQDYFIGLLGLALVVVFGVVAPLLRARNTGGERKPAHLQLLAACLAFTFLSIGQVYGTILKILPVPPLTGERVSSRFFTITLAALLALAAIYLQRWLDRRRLPAWGQLVMLGLSVMLYHDLNQHLQAWRIRYLDGLVYLFPKVPFDAAQHTISNHADPQYFALLGGGAAAAALALAFLVVMAWKERKRNP